MYSHRILFFFAALTFSISAYTEPNEHLWKQLFKAISFSETSKASFKPACQPSHPLASTPSYKELCPKLDAIPDSIIEAAALPYLKHYVTEDMAREAIAFWSSAPGKALTKKILQDIATGNFNHLDAEDIRLLNMVSKTEYGRALNALGKDNAQGSAVVQAMLYYAP
jgi:hypothetical protein